MAVAEALVTGYNCAPRQGWEGLMVGSGSFNGRSGPSRTLVHVGMLLAGLAFASWWTTHTVLDTSRTRRVTDAVIGNVEVRHYLARAIAPVAM